MDPVFTTLMSQELGALEMLDHPHVVRVLDLFEDDDNIYIISEILRNGNLLEIVKKMKQNGEKFSEQDISNIVYQVLLGVNYIHGTNMIHRELKLENIMVDIQ